MADEIMKEMWRIKDELSARFPDMHAMFRYYQHRERESGRKYVTLVKKAKKGRRPRARA
jgi:hypothetical protein